MVILALALMGLAAGCTSVAVDSTGDSALFAIDIISYPDSVVIGIAQPMVGPRGVVEGWYTTSVFADVHYLGKDPLPVVSGSYPGYWDNMFSISAEVVDQTGTLLDRCRPSGYVNEVFMGAPHLDPGWSKSLDIPVCIPGPGVYEVRVVAQATADATTNLQGEVLNLWTGRAASESVTIRITAPEGVDKETYDAFNHDPLGNTERWGEVLRRFPTSSYATFIVWKTTSRTIERIDIGAAIRYMEGNVPRTRSVPCDDPELCNRNSGWMSLSWDDYLAWKSHWIEIALEHHSDISFTDDLRFSMALDKYLQGDREGCSTILTDLFENGQASAGEKAKELLDVIRAKGALKERVGA